MLDGVFSCTQTAAGRTDVLICNISGDTIQQHKIQYNGFPWKLTLRGLIVALVQLFCCSYFVAVALSVVDLSTFLCGKETIPCVDNAWTKARLDRRPCSR